jgi:hypothetical protein
MRAVNSQRSSGSGESPAAGIRWVIALFLTLAMGAGPLRADNPTFPYTFTRVGSEYRLSLSAYDRYYFGFLHTGDLQQPFQAIKMALGTPAPIFGYTPATGEFRGFFRAEALDLFGPNDTDGDGIDDVWELKNGLDPLNPADALLPNAIDPSKTNLEYYREHFGLTRVTGFYSREVSIDNHPFAISDELSVFNFPLVTGISVEAITKEVSVYNFPSFTGASVEALSKEVSIFNVPAFTGASVEAMSKEVSIFNTPAPTVPSVEAISKEVTAFNSPAPTGPSVEAISDEVSVFNSFTTSANAPIVSREVSVQNTP